MLVESIVKKTLGLKSWKVVNVCLEEFGLLVELEERKGSRGTCGVCGARGPCHDHLQERYWGHVPLWGIAVILVYAPRRIKCPRCRKVKVESMPWSMGKSPLTVPLIIMLATFAKMLPWEEVARLFNVSWNTVQAAVLRSVEYGLSHRDTSGVTVIGIDEISRRKGHVYVTNVYDLIHKRLLWSGDGRARETLERFFDEWGVERTKAIRCVCCDMWEPYVAVINDRAPNALLVFDKYHVVSHLIKAVDEVRREEAAELKKTNPELLKKTRYIYLKNPWNLTPKQRQRLGHLERMNLRTNRAYLLKEAFREFWEYKSLYHARRYLKKWFWWATHSRLKPMRDFAWMLRRHEDGVLSYFKSRVSNGAVEGMNRKAKVVSQRAYGYRTFKTFALALYHVMADLPMPEFSHKFF